MRITESNRAMGTLFRAHGRTRSCVFVARTIANADMPASSRQFCRVEFFHHEYRLELDGSSETLKGGALEPSNLMSPRGKLFKQPSSYVASRFSSQRRSNKAFLFVSDIYAAKGREESEEEIASIPLLVPQVPQQVNGTECGFFVLCYIYLFIKSAPQSFSLNDYPYFEKLKDQKMTQPSSPSPAIATADDAYARKQRSRTGENQHSSKCVQSSGSVIEPKIQRKRVQLSDMGGEVVATNILISEDEDKVVMGRALENLFCEISILVAVKPDAPLFIKDAERQTLGDAVGSHIAWFKDYVPDHSLFAYDSSSSEDSKEKSDDSDDEAMLSRKL
ncbi:hypothetical protein Taro_035421 [Colocasia esculenta]|uniref:Ubiquitin-like protease family profile domain-containing protein n=1 Tax=Colocasia esculenta TaxID=4460 RepID=A0A843W6M5_COLES|nr:hypothetical protein [Colocasia esculenta]